jgi:antirestriction protein ArdC
VVYWGRLEQESEPAEDGDTNRPRLFAKGYTVFNADQVDGLRMPKRFQPKLSHNARIQRAEAFFAPLAQVRDGGNRAFYRASNRCQPLPSPSQRTSQSAQDV